MAKHRNYDAIIAYANGEPIQFKDVVNGRWCDSVLREPLFDKCEYRPKPKQPDYAKIARDAFYDNYGSREGGWEKQQMLSLRLTEKICNLRGIRRV